MRFRLLYILVFFVLQANLKAQQVPLYSLYVMNNFLINPAIAGAQGYGSVNLTTRQQWLGFEDSPTTYALGVHNRLRENSFIRRNKKVRSRWRNGYTSSDVGLGGYIFNDSYGALSRTGLRLTYAYHLYNKSNGTQLSFGLSLAGYQLKFNEDKVIPRDQGDELWISARESVFIPDADVGVYYSTPDYFVGFSSDQLLESTFKFGQASYDRFKMERNYYLLGGYDLDIQRKIVFSPSALIKYSESGSLQAEISGKVSYDQFYWGGISYRTENTIIVMAGIKVQNYIFAYAFDFAFSNIMRKSYGSHEFVIAMKWGELDVRRYRWLNR